MTESEKVRLHQRCIQLLEEKITALEKNIQEIQQANSEDTKSSAGDKFETSREMMKQEMDKLGARQSQAVEMLKFLRQIDPHLQKDRVGAGSLVFTNEGTYFFSVSLGKVLMNGQPYFALSMNAPVGKALFNRKAGEEVDFMGRKIRINEIV